MNENLQIALISTGTLIIGFLLSFWASRQSRKQLKEQFELNIQQQKEQFELNVQHQKEINSLERKDKFRLVAVEKRLEAHQVALQHWYKLLHVIHEQDQSKRNAVINDATEFWDKHCLYLEKGTRELFRKAIHIVMDYQMNLQLARELRKEGSDATETDDLIKENWKIFHSLLPLIFSEVELEQINIPTDIDPITGEKISSSLKPL